MLALHLCLALGLRIDRWRHRVPAAEIDLIAERTVGLSYQRWSVQVKNTSTNLDIDRVDREIGAAAGLGMTHILFVVPRASCTDPARAEMLIKSRLTGLHIFYLNKSAIRQKVRIDRILRELESQSSLISFTKRHEARRRETNAVDSD